MLAKPEVAHLEEHCRIVTSHFSTIRLALICKAAFDSSFEKRLVNEMPMSTSVLRAKRYYI